MRRRRDNDPVNNVDPNGDSWIRKSWSFVKEASGYNDVKRAIKNPSPLNIAKAAINFIPVGKVVKVAAVVGTGGYKAVKAAKASQQMKKAKNVSCPINCFVAGTLVTTSEGLKKVEDIETGDLVLSKNDETGDTQYKKVEYAFTRIAPEVYTIVAGDESYGVTGEHPFWVVNKGWVEAEELVVGDLLTDKTGKEISIRDIIKEEEDTNVYNFSVADYHTYFVGQQRIWTHNCKKKNHGNSLDTTKPTDVYVIRDSDTHKVLRFGETTQGYEKRGKQWERVFAKKGIKTYVEPLITGISKKNARKIETRYIKTYEKIYKKKPKYNKNYH